jgi:hypothetical protein
MTRVAALAVAVVVTALAAPAGARGRTRVEGVIGGAVGVTIPAGDSEYTRFADPTVKFSIRGGAHIFLTERFALAPVGILDLSPMNNDVSTFRPTGIAGVKPLYGRFRFLAGIHFLVAFKFGAFYVGPAFGIDGITGTEQAHINNNNVGDPVSRSTVAFTLQPETGVMFYPAKRLYVGFHFAVPIAVAHGFGRSSLDPFPNNFHAVDVDLLATIGARL